MEEKTNSKNGLDYKSWDYFQRLIKNHKTLNLSSQKDAVFALAEEIEQLLDGDNKFFDQQTYLKKKDDLEKLLRIVDSKKSFEKIAS